MREVIACSREQKGSKLFTCSTWVCVKKPRHTVPSRQACAAFWQVYQYEHTPGIAYAAATDSAELSLFGLSGTAKGILRVIAQTLQPAVDHVVEAVFRKSTLFQSATD